MRFHQKLDIKLQLNLGVPVVPLLVFLVCLEAVLTVLDRLPLVISAVPVVCLHQPRSGEDGTLSYREIEQSYLSSYTRHWDDQVKVPWLYNKEAKIMINYEDPQSIAIKARYGIQNHLGGMMFWDLGQDDSKSTLLDAIYKQLGEN